MHKRGKLGISRTLRLAIKRIEIYCHTPIVLAAEKTA